MRTQHSIEFVKIYVRRYILKPLFTSIVRKRFRSNMVLFAQRFLLLTARVREGVDFTSRNRRNLGRLSTEVRTVPNLETGFSLEGLFDLDRDQRKGPSSDRTTLFLLVGCRMPHGEPMTLHSARCDKSLGNQSPRKFFRSSASKLDLPSSCPIPRPP